MRLARRPVPGRRLLVIFMAALAALEPGALPALAQGQASSQSGAAPALTTLDVSPAYRVGSGDVVYVTVFPVEEYAREVTVQPDGMVELPMIGAVLIKGLTLQEIQVLLEGKYARYVASPRVSVTLRRFSGRRVAIIGEVKASGFYEYRDGMTLLELVAMAGGLSDLAKPSRVRILRLGADKPHTLTVNFKRVMEGRLDKNPVVMAGDTVYVPKGRYTQNAQWVNTNVLPWLTLMTLIASLIITVNTQTR